MAKKFFINGIRKFNEKKVFDKFLRLLDDNPDIKQRYQNDLNNEIEAYTLIEKGCSTQGLSVKRMMGGRIIVELPWLASESDVRLCYALLKAVKAVHRASRIVDDNDKNVKLTDCDAHEEWLQRRHNMEELLQKGETTVVTGVNRDFHLNPKRYTDCNEATVNIEKAYQDFIALQWTDLDTTNVVEEKRHISADEELSTLRVVDNSANVFICACQYVGMMKDNTCKILRFEEFCQLMKDRESFRQMDAAQVFLDQMDSEEWDELFDTAGGMVKTHFRKTFIMRWNTDISNYKLFEFDSALEDFHEEGFYYDWSIWDYQKVHIGDRFYMIRTGDGKNGVVMRGTIIGMPYQDEDWSGKGRKVYYIRMSLTHMMHPERSPLLLTTDALTNKIPGFNWREGHSGEMLPDDIASLLEQTWHDFEEEVHQTASDDRTNKDFNKVYKEKGWKKPEPSQLHGNHIDTFMEAEDYIENIFPQISQWPLYGSAHTYVTTEDYLHEKGDIIALRTGEEMGLMALLLNNEKCERLDLITSFPCHRGIKHEMTIKKVFEWDNEIEAIVWGEMENLTLAFFATDYYVNKAKYQPGSKVNVELAASAYYVVKPDTNIVIEGEEAALMREAMEMEMEYDEEGKIMPLYLSCENLVGYIDHDETSPDDAEFASKIHDIKEIHLQGIDFIKATISICHEPEETYVPLYFRKDLLPEAEKGMLLQGLLWMQGQIGE